MNRGLMGALVLIILLQIGAIAIHFAGGGGAQDLRAARLEHLTKFLLATSKISVSVTNYNMTAARAPELATEYEKEYQDAKVEAMKELDALEAAFAGNANAVELVGKARKLSQIGETTVENMKTISEERGGERQGRMLVLFAGMMKLTKVTNGLLEVGRQLGDEAAGPKDAGGPGGMIDVAIAAATMLAAIAGFALASGAKA